MAEFENIPPVHSTWPTRPIGEAPERRPGPREGEKGEGGPKEGPTEEETHDEKKDDRPHQPPAADDGLPHVDEYA